MKPMEKRCDLLGNWIKGVVKNYDMESEKVMERKQSRSMLDAVRIQLVQNRPKGIARLPFGQIPCCHCQ